ncbi:hypothetical protein Q9Q95_06690 [Sphingomonas sp. DG1-23]|uniref:hypothetical protein n=1 Tax=Sphingomonas sp. DG1-23 TaxID=3068316 RepID=UPI00273FE714|nr:hypothetical protein [Sphingomonas sp. DG1-23]MDP5278605.1 hypothetical protein [Sphingomonas sp. DG1-23]
MIAALLLAGLLAGQSAPAASADPLAPARAGKLRCIAPNAARLTCRTIIRYKVESDGDFDATVTGLVSRDSTVLLRYKTFGRVEEGGVCVMMRTGDIQNGMLLSSGRPLAPNADDAMRLQVLGAMQPLQGKKRCYLDRTEDGVTRSIVTLDGIAHPELTQTVAWVAPGEGYAVGR